jgi:hypothetical protein
VRVFGGYMPSPWILRRGTSECMHFPQIPIPACLLVLVSFTTEVQHRFGYLRCWVCQSALCQQVVRCEATLICTAEGAAKPACNSCAYATPTAVASASRRTEETRTKRQLQQLHSGDCYPRASSLGEKWGPVKSEDRLNITNFVSFGRKQVLLVSGARSPLNFYFYFTLWEGGTRPRLESWGGALPNACIFPSVSVVTISSNTRLSIIVYSTEKKIIQT